MKVIIGNLLNVAEGTIAHQTNCIGVAGAGVALGIARMYPDWKTSYRAVCHHYSIDYLMGQIHLYEATPSLTIASLFAQRVPGRGLMTNYDALAEALYSLHENAPPGLIYLPYGVGCGLAGGDWNIVQPLIQEHCPEAILVRLK